MPSTLANRKGLTLIGALTALTILAVLATFLGQLTFYITRTRLRTESKASLLNTKDTVIGLVSRRMVGVLDGGICPPDLQAFQTAFNSRPIIFPGSNATLSLAGESDLSLLNNFPTPPPGEVATALEDCKQPQGIKVPPPNDRSPYIFCLALQNPSPESSRNFIDSEGAFLQIRIELISTEMEQDEKQFGSPLSCSVWHSRGDQRQFKVFYRAFWKRKGDPNGFFNYMGSQFVNLFELRDESP